MKKLLIISLITSIFHFETKAQNIEVRKGSCSKEKGSYATLLGSNNETFFIVRNDYASNSFTLEKYSRISNNLEYSKNIEIPQINNQKVKFENLLFINGQIILFTSFYDKKQDLIFAYANYINSVGEIDNNFKVIGQIKCKGKDNLGTFSCEASEDSKNIRVYMDGAETAEEKNFSETFSVLNDKLEVVANKKIVLPYQIDFFGFKQIFNNDNAYILASIKKSNPEKSTTPYITKLFSYNLTNNTFKEQEINIEGGFLCNIKLKINEQGNLIYGGYYLNEIPEINQIFEALYSVFGIRLSGVFWGCLDKTNFTIISKGNKNLDNAFKVTISPNETLFPDNNQLIALSDGGVIMTLEEYANSTGIFYLNIHAIKFEKDGSVKWSKDIFKYQNSVTHSSYVASYNEVNASINLMFNDIESNSMLSEEQTLTAKQKCMSEYSKKVPMLVVIDNNGNATRKPLTTDPDLGGLKFTRNFRIDKSKIIILGNNEKFAEITFK
ncbi:MAG: hypothetical protein V4547_12420 [Bacteroidota bacterium]